MWLEMFSRISSSITFPETEVRVTNLQFLKSSSLPFLKTGVTFAFLQYSGTSLSLHDQSTILENDLTVTSASSHSTRGCIPSGPMDFHMSSLPKYSLICFSSNKGTPSLLRLSSLSLGPRFRESQSC